MPCLLVLRFFPLITNQNLISSVLISCSLLEEVFNLVVSICLSFYGCLYRSCFLWAIEKPLTYTKRFLPLPSMRRRYYTNNQVKRRDYSVIGQMISYLSTNYTMREMWFFAGCFDGEECQENMIFPLAREKPPNRPFSKYQIFSLIVGQ